MSMTVKVNSRMSAWAELEKINQDEAARAMANAIDNLASAKAPELTKALKNNGCVRKIRQSSYEIQYGDEAVPYARRRHFENKKNPQTKNYLRNAGHEVVKRGIGAYL